MHLEVREPERAGIPLECVRTWSMDQPCVEAPVTAAGAYVVGPAPCAVDRSRNATNPRTAFEAASRRVSGAVFQPPRSLNTSMKAETFALLLRRAVCEFPTAM